MWCFLVSKIYDNKTPEDVKINFTKLKEQISQEHLNYIKEVINYLHKLKSYTQTPISIEGEGIGEKFVLLTSGVATFTMGNNSKQNFSVFLRNSDGIYVDTLSSINFENHGKKTIIIKQDGTYLIQVIASGKWQIDIN